MDHVLQFFQQLDNLVWGAPLLVLLVGTGIYLTLRLGLLQIRYLPKAFRLIFTEDEGHGDISSFGALATALAATVGTGNIVGVATAIQTGGPGALFWMWMAAFFGMATISYFLCDCRSVGGPLWDRNYDPGQFHYGIPPSEFWNGSRSG